MWRLLGLLSSLTLAERPIDGLPVLSHVTQRVVPLDAVRGVFTELDLSLLQEVYEVGVTRLVRVKKVVDHLQQALQVDHAFILRSIFFFFLQSLPSPFSS
jgi:hypothetical protein